MRVDSLVTNQLHMAQAIDALADHIGASTGYALTAVAFADLPAAPVAGMIACVSDSAVNTWGGVIAGGGTSPVIGFYDGAAWKVMGA